MCIIYVRVNIGLSPFSSRVPEVEHGQDSSESCQPAAVHGRRNFLNPRPDTDYIRRSRRQPTKNEYKRKLPVRHNLLNFTFIFRMILAFENDRQSKIDMFDKYLNPWPRSVTLFPRVSRIDEPGYFSTKRKKRINFGILDSFSREITTIWGGDRIVISAVDSLRRFFPRFRFRKKAEEFRPAVER